MPDISAKDGYGGDDNFARALHIMCRYAVSLWTTERVLCLLLSLGSVGECPSRRSLPD